MIKMILADDEVIITRGIQKLVDWETLGIEVIGVYEDGKSAFDGIVRLQPELALLDISMPGMSGVEIIRECRKLGIKTQIIFISGFQDFEYAKSAIKYGAVDYLLKPVIREELLNAVEKCLPVTEEGEEKEQETTSAEDYSRLIEVEDTTYTPVYVDILYPKDANEQMKKLIRFSFVSFIEEYLETNKIGITFSKKNHIAVILKGLSEEKGMQAILELWKKSVEVTAQQTVFVVGKSVKSMSDIPGRFGECLLMRDYFFFVDQLQIPILKAGTPVFGREVPKSRFEKVKEEMIAAIIGQDLPAFERYFYELGKLICWMADGKKEDACFYFCSAIRLAEEKIIGLGIEETSIETKELLDTGRNCESYQELLEVYHAVLQKYSSNIQKTAVSSERKTFLKARAFIETHYNENLTLNILAEEVHMNPYYFSAFFKKNAEENFKDYVSRIRIEHAVPLLVSTDKKTYEIATEVGFTDARTFSEMFQRYYHETPNAYRKRIIEMQQDIIRKKEMDSH